jgi:hypothetical protein
VVEYLCFWGGDFTPLLATAVLLQYYTIAPHPSINTGRSSQVFSTLVEPDLHNAYEHVLPMQVSDQIV